MSIKRWKGATSTAWATLGADFANANWMDAAGTGLAAAIPQGLQTQNLTDLSWPSQGAGVTVTANVAAGPQLVAGDAITLAGAIHGDGVHTIVTSNTTTYTFVADTTDWGADEGPYAQGTLYFAGDDVQMLSGDKGTNYCKTGPTAAITVASLTITIAANIGDPQIFNANGANLSISTGGFSLVEAAGSTMLGTILGGSASRLILLTGCTGAVTAQPGFASVRSVSVDVNAGATLTLTALAYKTPATDTGSLSLGASSIIAGTVILDAASASDGVRCSSAVLAATGVLNINKVCRSFHSVVVTGAGTINVNVESALVPSSPYYNGNGLIINANAPLLIYDPTSASIIADNVTINAAAPVTLASFGVAADKTLTVAVTGAHEITQVDVTGTVTVNGTASIAAQYAADQAAVLAAVESIKDDATILSQAGTYDFTAAIAAGYANGEADQLAADEAVVAARVNDIIVGSALLGQSGKAERKVTELRV